MNNLTCKPKIIVTVFVVVVFSLEKLENLSWGWSVILSELMVVPDIIEAVISVPSFCFLIYSCSLD